MALHLVSDTISKKRASDAAASGQLTRVMRGVYVDQGDDIDATLLQHAVRIAHYLYPTAYLSAASAELPGPTREGRLFISGKRRRRTRLRALEIIQNEAAPSPSVVTAVVADGLGEFSINLSSPRQRLLEAFRVRTEHAASIDAAMREAIAVRLIEEHGSPQKAADAVWSLARENGWYREGELAERFLLKRETVAVAAIQHALVLTVAWHSHPIGELRHDGFEWRWKPRDSHLPPLVRQTTPGALPPFILSLLPEGWLEKVLKDPDERAILRSGTRYMSNITIVQDERELSALSADVLMTELREFTREGIFTGTYDGPGRESIEQSFEQNLANLYRRDDMPRLSGIQIKAPMYLNPRGVLRPSAGRPFTHILKPAGAHQFESLPLVEWLTLTLGRAAGLSAPDIALVRMPDDMPPALLVERFDLRTSAHDQRFIALEDMCSVLDLPASAKYSGTMERVAKAVRQLSTSPEEDAAIVLKRALLAWFVADGDMHLKNMALLKTAYPGQPHFATVRMAPLFDAVMTRVLPGFAADHLALKINGKDDRLRRADFEALATVADIAKSRTDAIIEEMLTTLAAALDRVRLPKAFARGDIEGKLLDLCRQRIGSFMK